MSHAWARTVDGAQGGTWLQVHLLGTPTLDRFTGYVGQSRGQLPTHTWNTRPEPDHPVGLLADQSTPAEAVVDAMHRAEPKTFAAADDHWTLDRQLRTERDQHTTVIADRPPDRQADLDTARHALARAADERDRATRTVAVRESERDRLGPLTNLRRGGRDDITRADQNLAAAHRHLDRAGHDLDTATTRLAELEAAVAARVDWERAEGWRIDRVADIDDALAHHWAQVTLRAVRADDPLAFGIDQVRHARATYRADLDEILATLPPDRRDALTQAQDDLARRQQHLHQTDIAVTRARTALEEARQRHWGRRDKPAIHAAERHHTAAEQDRQAAADAIEPARARVVQERAGVHTWTEAITATAEPRTRLSDALDDLDTALDHVRPGRVAAAVGDPTNQLWDVLGPPPRTRGGLAAWCGIAEQLEAHNDRNPRSVMNDLGSRRSEAQDLIARLDRLTGPQWDRPATLAMHTDHIINAAERLDPSPAHDPLADRPRWRPAVERAVQAMSVERHPRTIEHHLGLGR